MNEIPTDTSRISINTIKVNIPGLKETGSFYLEEDPEVICVECEMENPYTGICPKCGCYEPNYVCNGYADVRRIHDISIGRNAIDLYFRGHRYKCKDCGSTFSEPIDFAKPRYWLTNRLIETIQKDAAEHSFTYVAKRHGITITWVKKLFMDYADAIDRKRVISAPEVLGIDEVHICDKMRLVLTDSEHGRLIDMHPRKTRPTVKKAIHSLDGYENIKFVTIDMDTGYRNTINDILPNTMVIIDRFHVVRYISSAAQSAKKQIVENLKVSVKAMPPGPDRNRKLQLLTELGNDSYLFKFGKKKLEGHPERMEFLLRLCKEFPELRELYTVKRNAERIYEDATTADEAMELFQIFVDSIPEKGLAYKEFHAFKKMFLNWNEEILNYFRSGKHFTNAATEGLNNQIKTINNEGKGYSFETLRAKCIVNLFGKEKQHIVSSRKKYKKSKNM